MRFPLFLMFFVSGFCGLLYQIVWLRLAFASFGVVTPVLSVLISVFMAGLALGSWLGGRSIGPLVRRTGRSALQVYGLVEIGIGVGAFAVPRLFAWGEGALLGSGQAGSATYLAGSALVITLAVLPWCVLMGTTYPFVAAWWKQLEPHDESGFSFLYLANVVGAMAGVGLTALVLVESLGFRASLALAGCLNLAVGASALWLGARGPRGAAAGDAARPATRLPGPAVGGLAPAMLLLVLFVTGFASMAMEVVWTRAFTPILSTTIYAFASLLGVYLLATWLGTALHRAALRAGRAPGHDLVLGLVALAASLPLWLPDPRVAPTPAVALASIFPFSFALGYLTPRLIDEYSAGRPESVGRAYAWNILGSILGPLCAGYLLLPWLGSKGALLALTAPLVIFALAGARRARPTGLAAAALSLGLLGFVGLRSATYEDGSLYPDAEVRRDHTATVIAATREDGRQQLLVNGFGITYKTPITKLMAHLPMAFHDEPVRDALVICFGMGTTLRSLSTWDVPVTAVELVPSVRDSFGYFFDDADAVLARPGVSVVIDDGRRFLARTDRRFDVVTIDPPPPVSAAGSSLLYSLEFYELLKQRMAPGAILQQWLPGGDEVVFQGAVGALKLAFRHVRVFRSAEGWGMHLLASMEPIPGLAPDELLARLPAAARRDLREWLPEAEAEALFTRTLSQEISVAQILRGWNGQPISDDKPLNEYYLLRRLRGR